jgi:hypothetical protein
MLGVVSTFSPAKTLLTATCLLSLLQNVKKDTKPITAHQPGEACMSTGTCPGVIVDSWIDSLFICCFFLHPSPPLSVLRLSSFNIQIYKLIFIWSFLSPNDNVFSEEEQTQTG